MELEDVGWKDVDWIYLIQCREQSQKISSTVIKLSDSIKC
jgi:hypothetical protein